MRHIITAAILLLTISLTPMQAEERLGLDPVLRGLWTAHAYSEDGGQTVDDIHIELAIATATRIRFAEGTTVNVHTVLIGQDREGNTTNLAILCSGRVMVFTEAYRGMYLVQVMDIEKEVEVSRWVITVQP